MGGWIVGGVGKTRCRWDGLCPLANTDAGNIEYCCLLRRAVFLEVLEVTVPAVCLGGVGEVTKLLSSSCLRRPTKKMRRRRQYSTRRMAKWAAASLDGRGIPKGARVVTRRCRHK